MYGGNLGCRHKSPAQIAAVDGGYLFIRQPLRLLFPPVQCRSQSKKCLFALDIASLCSKSFHHDAPKLIYSYSISFLKSRTSYLTLSIQPSRPPLGAHFRLAYAQQLGYDCRQGLRNWRSPHQNSSPFQTLPPLAGSQTGLFHI